MGCGKYNQKSELILYYYSHDDFSSCFTAEVLHHTINRMGIRAKKLFNQKKHIFFLINGSNPFGSSLAKLGDMIPNAESSVCWVSSLRISWRSGEPYEGPEASKELSGSQFSKEPWDHWDWGSILFSFHSSKFHKGVSRFKCLK